MWTAGSPGERGESPRRSFSAWRRCNYVEGPDRGEEWRGKAGRGKARSGSAGPGLAGLGAVRCARVWHGIHKENHMKKATAIGPVSNGGANDIALTEPYAVKVAIEGT